MSAMGIARLVGSGWCWRIGAAGAGGHRVGLCERKMHLAVPRPSVEGTGCGALDSQCVKPTTTMRACCEYSQGLVPIVVLLSSIGRASPLVVRVVTSQGLGFALPARTSCSPWLRALLIFLSALSPCHFPGPGSSLPGRTSCSTALLRGWRAAKATRGRSRPLRACWCRCPTCSPGWVPLLLLLAVASFGHSAVHCLCTVHPLC